VAVGGRSGSAPAKRRSPPPRATPRLSRPGSSEQNARARPPLATHISPNELLDPICRQLAWMLPPFKAVSGEVDTVTGGRPVDWTPHLAMTKEPHDAAYLERLYGLLDQLTAFTGGPHRLGEHSHHAGCTSFSNHQSGGAPVPLLAWSGLGHTKSVTGRNHCSGRV
jgi:hypothetical protein